MAQNYAYAASFEYEYFDRLQLTQIVSVISFVLHNLHDYRKILDSIRKYIKRNRLRFFQQQMNE